MMRIDDRVMEHITVLQAGRPLRASLDLKVL